MSGHLEVITGPMYAGKSEELMRRLRRAQIANQKTIVIKPSIDDRYGAGVVSSHIGNQWSAYSVKDSYQMWDILTEGNEEYDVIAIDEVQFFDEDITGVVFALLKQGKRVIVSGLDMDFRQDPFSVMPDLLAIAKFVVKLRAVCQSCGEDAMYTQRLLNNGPAPLDGDTVIIGGKEQYEARCENCWEAG